MCCVNALQPVIAVAVKITHQLQHHWKAAAATLSASAEQAVTESAAGADLLTVHAQP
jgi:hypothetical protein